MSFKECDSLIKYYNDDYSNRWEQIRYLAFITAKCQGAELKTPSELLPFPWDVKVENQINSIEDLQQVKQRLLDLMSRV